MKKIDVILVCVLFLTLICTPAMPFLFDRIRSLEETVKELHCNCVMPDTVPAQAPEDKPMQPLQEMSEFGER